MIIQSEICELSERHSPNSRGVYRKRDSRINPKKITTSVEKTIMSSQPNVPNINDFFQRFESILLQTWKETGFGHLEIDSERIRQDKIQVIIRGSTHYRYVVSDEEVGKWPSQ